MHSLFNNHRDSVYELYEFTGNLLFLSINKSPVDFRRFSNRTISIIFMASTNSSLIKTLSNIQKQIIIYAHPIYLALGLTFCFLNILLFSRKKFRTVSCCTCKYFFFDHKKETVHKT